MRILLALILLAACEENTPPSPDAAPCEAYGNRFPPTPDDACAGVYQFDVYECTWSCSTWGLDGGVQ